MIDFTDLDNDLGTITTACEQPKQVYLDKCPKCRGTGIVGFARDAGRCYKCDGRGTIPFATPPEQRAAARAAKVAKVAKQGTDRWTAFSQANPQIAAWIVANHDYDFAASLYQSIQKWGSLTTNQLAAATRCANKQAERKQQAQQAISQAKAVSIERIEQAFSTAKASGLKKLKLRLGAFAFKPAPETGRNAGSIYVTEGELYLGKVTEGKFIRSRDCNSSQEAAIIAACADPEQAAIAHGKATGTCACCGRELTDPESIARSIGPICAEKWGW